MGLAGTNVHSRGKLDIRKSGKRKKGKAGGVWGGGHDKEDEDEEDEDWDDFPSNSGDQYESVKYNKKKIGSFGGNIKKRRASSNIGDIFGSSYNAYNKAADPFTEKRKSSKKKKRKKKKK